MPICVYHITSCKENHYLLLMSFYTILTLGDDTVASSLIYDLDLDPQSKWYTISATPQAKASLLYTQEIGNFFAGPRYNTSREAFPSYLLKLSLDGCGVL